MIFCGFSGNVSLFISDFIHLNVLCHFLSLREDLSILLIFSKSKLFILLIFRWFFSSLLHLFLRNLSVSPFSIMVAFVLFCRLYYNLFVLISFYRCWAPFSWFPCDVLIGSLFDFLGTGVNCDKLYLAAAFAASHRSRYVRTLIELAQGNRFSFLISSLI